MPQYQLQRATDHTTYRQIPILRGWSAARFQQLMTRGFMYCVAPGGVLTIASFALVGIAPASQRSRLWIVPPLFALVEIGLTMFFLGGVVMAMLTKQNKETLTGYTSLRGRSTKLPMVAPGTGIVIREVDAPDLSNEEYVRIARFLVSQGARLDVRVQAGRGAMAFLVVLLVTLLVGVVILVGEVWLLSGPGAGVPVVVVFVVGAGVVATLVAVYGRRRRDRS